MWELGRGGVVLLVGGSLGRLGGATVVEVWLWWLAGALGDWVVEIMDGAIKTILGKTFFIKHSYERLKKFVQTDFVLLKHFMLTVIYKNVVQTQLNIQDVRNLKLYHREPYHRINWYYFFAIYFN